MEDLFTSMGEGISAVFSSSPEGIASNVAADVAPAASDASAVAATLSTWAPYAIAGLVVLLALKR
jgi:hypothetical protein